MICFADSKRLDELLPLCCEDLVQVTYQKIVLCVFKHEVDTLLFEHHLAKRRNVDVQDLSIDLFSGRSRRASAQVAQKDALAKRRRTMISRQAL